MAYLRDRSAFVFSTTHSSITSSARVLILSSSLAALLLGACGGKTNDGEGTTSGDSDVSTDSSSGDGDGDTSNNGDGDGDGTTGGDGDDTTTNGDGDGDTASTGDGDTASTGDGDGDTTTSGDGDGDMTSGDGDGDGDSSGICRSDDDCVAASQTNGACYAPSCSAPQAATKAEVEADPCLVAWEGTTGPQVPSGCEYEGDLACPAFCIQPPVCVRPYCSASGSCELVVGQEPAACEVIDASCDELEELFDSALDEASVCLAGGTVATTECDDALTVDDLCGCPRIINNDQPLKAAAVQAARVAYQLQCEAPKICQVADCSGGTDSGTCELTEHPYGVCVFQ